MANRTPWPFAALAALVAQVASDRSCDRAAATETEAATGVATEPLRQLRPKGSHRGDFLKKGPATELATELRPKNRATVAATGRFWPARPRKMLATELRPPVATASVENNPESIILGGLPPP